MVQKLEVVGAELADDARRRGQWKDHTGSLRASITYWVDEEDLTVEVGTADPRGLWFEEGTVHMKARPFLEPTLDHDALSTLKRHL